MLKTRKIIAFVFILLIAADQAGCGQNNAGGAGAQTPAAIAEVRKSALPPEEKVKISFCLSQTGWGGEALDPELMKVVELAIEAKTNVDLEVIAPPQSSYNEKLNVMLSSGSAPDIFAVRKSMDNIQVYSARGYTKPLDDLLPNYGNITSQVNKEYWEYVKVGGKIQAVPMYVPMKKNIWIRSDYMDRYGMNLSPTPTTNEFYNEMLKLAGTGIIPFTFSRFLDNLPFFTNPFGAYFGIAMNEDGRFYDGFNTPEMKQALGYMVKLYAAGIWDPEFLTNENAMVREKLISGRAAAALDYWNRFIYYCSESEKINAPSGYVPVYELIGPSGKSGNLNEAINDVLAISPGCRNPGRALDVINYYVFTEEGVKLRCLGVEGKHYTVEGGVIEPTEKATKSGYKCDINQFYLYYPKVTEYGFNWGETTEKLIPRQLEINEEVERYLGPKYIVPGGKSALYDKNQPAYKKKIEETASMILIGATSMEQGYSDYESFWKSISGDEMLRQLNQ